jgi:hypothetical protein
MVNGCVEIKMGYIVSIIIYVRKTRTVEVVLVDWAAFV